MEAITTVETERADELRTQPLEPATAELHSPLASSDRCPNCRARMAADQRYCIDCGERRSGGGLRDAMPRTSVAQPARVRERRTVFANSNASLIAGIGTLLLAMGVGVLIGRTGHTTNTTSGRPQVVTVQTSGTAGTAGTGAATTSTASATSSTKNAASKARKHAAKTSTKSATSFQKAAAKSGVKLPPPVVKVGSKCPAGAKGCQGGKFTGNFFGGG